MSENFKKEIILDTLLSLKKEMYTKIQRSTINDQRSFINIQRLTKIVNCQLSIVIEDCYPPPLAPQHKNHQI